MRLLTICLPLLVLASCGTNNSKQYTDTYQSGAISIGVDPAFMPILELEKASFEASYLKTKINLVEMDQDKAIAYLINDSLRLAIADRDFNAEEKAKLADKKWQGRQIKLATDAIAVVLNPSNTDSSLTLAQIKAILNGEITTWEGINPKNSAGVITAVFDKADGSNINYLTQRLNLDKKTLAKGVYAVNSNAEVVQYVAKNKNAIGFVGVKHVLNPNDSTQQGFSKTIKVAEIGDTIISGERSYFKPYQAYLAMKKYPLRRDVYMLIKESRQGLPASFVNYACSDPGQRIILRAGLLPATAPVRIVSLK